MSEPKHRSPDDHPTEISDRAMVRTLGIMLVIIGTLGGVFAYAMMNDASDATCVTSRTSSGFVSPDIGWLIAILGSFAVLLIGGLLSVALLPENQNDSSDSNEA